MARVVVLMSLATGMLTEMALGPYSGKETGETALLRPLLSGFGPGDILLADRYFCSYFVIALHRRAPSRSSRAARAQTPSQAA